MNAVESFSAQMRSYQTLGGPTAPTWPGGVPAAPPVYQTPPVQQQPAQAAAYWYPLPAGNPERLTVATVIQRAYNLNPQRDSARIQEIANYVAQQNGIMLANWPIPPTTQGLRLPWAPTHSNLGNGQPSGPVIGQPGGQPGYGQPSGPIIGQPGQPGQPGRSSAEKITNIVAGIAGIAGSLGRIFQRHGGSSSPSQIPTYGQPGYGQPGYGQPGYNYGTPNQTDIIVGDVADAVPILANLGAILTGSPPPIQGYPQTGYNHPAPYYTQQPTPPYIPNTPTYAPPSYVPPQPYNPPIYQPPQTWQTNPGVPSYSQGNPNVPSYSQPSYNQPTYRNTSGGDWGSQVNQITSAVGSLAQSIGGIFGKR